MDSYQNVISNQSAIGQRLAYYLYVCSQMHQICQFQLLMFHGCGAVGEHVTQIYQMGSLVVQRKEIRQLQCLYYFVSKPVISLKTSVMALISPF
ncbi:hypothetical protein SS50377_20520 [Spironucleus salmonicida]|uniref:Uncharacterized protein n=1 Tax=Spironucleus salmonicida TaxID=348837 RepID=A0A9P8LYZ6_9EUKA|nr:hypothetical protein SS50377_20520 [Spironucleus salmonicida]